MIQGVATILHLILLAVDSGLEQGLVSLAARTNTGRPRMSLFAPHDIATGSWCCSSKATASHCDASGVECELTVDNALLRAVVEPPVLLYADRHAEIYIDLRY